GEKRLMVPLTEASGRSGSPPAQRLARRSARKLSTNGRPELSDVGEAAKLAWSARRLSLAPLPCRSSLVSTGTSVQTTLAAPCGACRYPCVDTVLSPGAPR